MLSLYFLLIILISNTLFAQDKSDLPFQVLVAQNASIYGDEVKPLQMVDDVTSIEVGENGFLSLVHKGGTTYEFREKIFTFYLKPEKLKDQNSGPNLDVLYSDSASQEVSKLITPIFPSFDRSGYIVWNKEEPFKLYWHFQDQPMENYILSVSDNVGNKIQDFRISSNVYEFRPSTFGLADHIFTFKISSTLGDETFSSKTYTVALQSAPVYEKKAADYVLKAADLEVNPTLALQAWHEALAMPNGKEYVFLFEKFLRRNEEHLTAAGQDVAQLLSQNK